MDNINVLLSALTRACHIHFDTIKVNLQMRKGLLSFLINSLDELFENNPQLFLIKLCRALLAVAYFGLLRIGEVAYSKHNQDFHKHTALAIMPILASEALLCEKNPATKCYP